MFPSFSGISGYLQETLPFPCLVFPAVMRYNESKKFEEDLFMQTVIIADVTKPGRYPNKGIAYSTVQWLKELCYVRRYRR